MVSVSKSSFAAPKSVNQPSQIHQSANHIDNATAQRVTAETRLAAKAIRARMQVLACVPCVENSSDSVGRAQATFLLGPSKNRSLNFAFHADSVF